MSKGWNTVQGQKFDFRGSRVFATIRESETGGPARRLITGREPHPTGRPTCIKAGFRAVPWESVMSEWPLIRLAEVASPIRFMRSQPHKLEMEVTGGAAPVLTFLPDFHFEAEARFVEELDAGKPFWSAALDWKPNGESFWRTLIVETKSDADRRGKDPDYLVKMDLARETYRRIGWPFAYLTQSKDLPVGRVAQGIEKIWGRTFTKVSMLDVSGALDALERAGGLLPYDEAAFVLGSGPIGKAKLAALHVRRVVRIDLSKGLSDESIVTPIGDRGAII
jgi:hypothetical protein